MSRATATEMEARLCRLMKAEDLARDGLDLGEPVPVMPISTSVV